VRDVTHHESLPALVAQIVIVDDIGNDVKCEIMLAYHDKSRQLD
jgi:hypothetical protein